MDASRCERFNQSSSSSVWENTDSFLSESVSVVLHESKETLESAWRLQNEERPLATVGSTDSPGNYSYVLICANHTTASRHGNCWDTHGMDTMGYTNTHHPDLRKATSHRKGEVGELMQMLIVRGQILVFQLIKTIDGLMRKQAALVCLHVDPFHSLHGFSQLSLKQWRYSDPPHTRGICQTDELTPKIDCISYDWIPTRKADLTLKATA